jgi:hypothetical protein
VESVSGAIVASVPQFGQVLRVKRPQKFNPDGTQHGQGSWFAIADSKNRGAQKRDGRDSHAFENGIESSPSFNGAEHETRHVKVPGMNWSGSDQPGYKAVCFRDEAGRRQKNDGVKQFGSGPAWFDKALDERRKEVSAAAGSGRSRKAASAMIAEIPFDLARYIARCFKPATAGRSETTA